MTEMLLIKFAHLLCLIYWLGGDLGVFYSSFSVVDERKSPEVRVNAAKILFGLDQGPRLCMPLILATGIQLGATMGLLQWSPGVVAAVWLVCLGWVAVVLTLHFVHGKDLGWLTRFDFYFRIAVILTLLWVSLGSLAGLNTLAPAWAAWKLLVFALLVACGLFIRIRLKPFGPAFAKLAMGEVDKQVNQDIRRSLAGSRPFVVTIWIGLLVNMAFGLHLLP